MFNPHVSTSSLFFLVDFQGKETGRSSERAGRDSRSHSIEFNARVNGWIASQFRKDVGCRRLRWNCLHCHQFVENVFDADVAIVFSPKGIRIPAQGQRVIERRPGSRPGELRVP